VAKTAEIAKRQQPATDHASRQIRIALTDCALYYWRCSMARIGSVNKIDFERDRDFPAEA